MKNIFRLSGVILLILSIFLIHSCKKKEEVPVIITTAGSNITATTATSGGNITNEGSSTVISRGVCWSTGTTPTIDDSKTTDGGGAGNFSSNINGLNGATIYYVRAYATNTVGTGYGMALSFTTLGQSPLPTIANATNLSATDATLNGAVNPNYLSTVVTFEYGTTTSYGSTSTATQSQVSGNLAVNVNASITGLSIATIYHFRIKAVNSLGTTYSDDITFKTLGLPPTVWTVPGISVSTTSAIFYGVVNANYASTDVTYEYGTTTSYGSNVPATPSTVTGHTNTTVSADIASLTAGTTYHYRIKALNILGTTYTDDYTFMTLGQVPTVTTMAPTEITNATAHLNGSVNANYLSTTITFEYGTTISYGSTASAIQGTVTGSHEATVGAAITGLLAGTTYHYRVKAVNSLGTTYGIDMILKTTITGITGTVSDIEGNTYQTIGIGYQTWMAENLKTIKYNDGTAIPNVTDNDAWSGLTTPGYCWYNNDAATYKATYGAMYNWYTVDTTSNGGKNVCPTSWHVPSDIEWTTLTTYLGGVSVAGGKLKETGTTHWTTPNTGATNETGFSALPGGYRGYYSMFYGIGDVGSWWSTTRNVIPDAWERTIFATKTDISKNSNNHRPYGFSVRCVRDF